MKTFFKFFKKVLFVLFLASLWLSLFLVASSLTAVLAIYILYPGLYFPSYADDRAQLHAYGVAGKAKIETGLTTQEQVAANALCALEDHRMFARTLPVDVRGIGRALVRNALRSRGNLEGASTIQMQVAKLSFTRADVRFRKGIAGRLASKLLQTRLAFELWGVPPKAVLASYLAALDCGLDGYRGFDVCAAYYFGKEPGELTMKEAIVVTSTVRAPNRYLRDVGLLGRRAEHAVRKMAEHGWLGENDIVGLNKEPPLQVRRDLDFARAVARRGDTGLSRAVIAARAAGLRGLEATIKKEELDADPRDFRLFVGLWEETGGLSPRLIAFAGGPESISKNRIEGGSFVKPFLGNMLRKKAGENYLHVEIPYRVVAYDKLGRPFTPGDVRQETLPSRAPVMTYLVKSSNAGNLSALSYAQVWLPASKLRQAAADLGITRRLAGKKADAKEPVLQIASAFAGTDLTPVLGSENFLGYGKAMAVLLRWFRDEMVSNIPSVELNNLDVSTVLGAGVSAPFESWVHGFSRIWFDPDTSCYSAWGKTMAAYSRQGTLKTVAAGVGGLPMKTHTAKRTAGSAVAFLARDRDGRVGRYVLASLLFRTDGAPVPDKVYGATVGAPATLEFSAAAKRAGLDIVPAGKETGGCGATSTTFGQKGTRP